jgi:hypothetical protein
MIDDEGVNHAIFEEEALRRIVMTSRSKRTYQRNRKSLRQNFRKILFFFNGSERGEINLK